MGHMATEGAVCTGRPAALPRPGKEAPEGRGLRWSPAPRACAFRCRCVAQADLLCSGWAASSAQL